MSVYQYMHMYIDLLLVNANSNRVKREHYISTTHGKDGSSNSFSRLHLVFNEQGHYGGTCTARRLHHETGWYTWKHSESARGRNH